MKKRPHLIVDVARCQGCNNCMLACKDEHVGNEWPGYTRAQGLHGERWVEIPCRERGQFPLIDVTYRPTLCTHCADAPCVDRASGAIAKRPDGIVMIDPLRARDPKLVAACPYGRIVWSDESGAAQKCTLCAHLLDDGWDKPRCVQACGPGALSFVRMTDADFATYAAAEGLETMHPGRIEDTMVCYKNLSRFSDCFVAGSVAVEHAGSVDCAAGAVAVLERRTGGAEGSDEIAEAWTTTADTFGDFKFDGLKPRSGGYRLTVSLPGHKVAELTFALVESLNVGTIFLRAGVEPVVIHHTPTEAIDVVL